MGDYASRADRRKCEANNGGEPDKERTSSPMILATVRISSSTRCWRRVDEKLSYSMRGSFDLPFACATGSSKSESLACRKGGQSRCHRCGGWEAAYVEAVRVVGVAGVAVGVLVVHGRVVRWDAGCGVASGRGAVSAAAPRRGEYGRGGSASSGASRHWRRFRPAILSHCRASLAGRPHARYVFRHAHRASPSIF